MTEFLLDTCAVVWTAHNDPLREPAASRLQDAYRRGARLFVSPITAWEIAMLATKGKIALALDPDLWFRRYCDLPSVTLAAMPPSVLVSSTGLPGAPPRDPADRILIATARTFGYVLVTRDARILEYGSRGHVRVIEC
ncbi:MAG: type II toxin-antitoxin system VapC family toxin [Acidobacteria bacterium]|nr:type II toxin-antitoxin system VapC family toxin [Acidobacteriota bacterium]